MVARTIDVEELDISAEKMLKHTHRIINEVRRDIDFWGLAWVSCVTAIGVLSIASAVIMALQSDPDYQWLKPFGIFAAAGVAGLTIIASSLRLATKADVLTSVYHRMINASNRFEMDWRRANKELPLERLHAFVDEFNGLRVEALRARRAAALGDAAPAPAAHHN